MKIEKYPDGTMSLDVYGLKMEINPYKLMNEKLSEESSNMLDIILEKQFKKLLTKVSNTHDINESKEYVNTLREKIDPSILEVARFIRELSLLHSDFECVNLTEEEKEINDWCYTIYKYNSNYGHVGIKTVTV